MIARSRVIKPQFFTDEVLGELSAYTRLLYAGMRTIADREGKLENRPKTIKLFTLPHDEDVGPDDIAALIQGLESAGILETYSVDGLNLIRLLGWGKKEMGVKGRKPIDKANGVHWNETESELPDPQGDSLYSSYIEPNKSLDSSYQVSKEEGKGKEKGKEEGKEEDREIPFDEIVEDLNDVIGLVGRHRFKSQSEYIRKEIRGRWAEGYRLEDFKHVHRAQVSHWLNDPKMRKHLAPDTLYRASKFPKYLANPVGSEQSKSHEDKVREIEEVLG